MKGLDVYKIANALIRMGSVHPEMRGDLRPVLAFLKTARVMSPQLGPIAKALQIRPDVAEQVASMLEDGVSSREADKILTQIDKLIRGYGAEALVPDGEMNPIAYYLNNGDTYKTTVLYNVHTRKFEMTSWGDFLEYWESDN